MIKHCELRNKIEILDFIQAFHLTSAKMVLTLSDLMKSLPARMLMTLYAIEMPGAKKKN